MEVELRNDFDDADIEQPDQPFWSEASDAWSKYSDQELDDMLRQENVSRARELNAQNGWGR